MKNEKRLIDADELKEKLQEHHDFFVYGCGGFSYLTPKDKARVDEITNCIAEITNAPTIDAVEVVHGRWIAVPSSDMMTGKAYKCSECNKIRYGSFMPNYCAICGAKMDGEVNHE